MSNFQNRGHSEVLDNGVTIGALQTTTTSTWLSMSYGKWHADASIFPGQLEGAVDALKRKAPKFLAQIQERENRGY